MNENLNLLEILKDCPQHNENGQKLYSPICGECILEKIDDIITVNYQQDELRQWMFFAKNGHYLGGTYGEVMLFPSKEQRNWSKFNPKGKDTPSIKDIFNNALSEKQAAERAVKERNERLDNECMAYTGKIAEKFINEFSFLGKYGFSLKRDLTKEDNYYYNYGRKAYSVIIKSCSGTYIMRLHFPQGNDGKLMICSTYSNGYYTGTFEEFAKKLTEWFNFTI